MEELLYHEKFKDFNLNFLFHVLESEGHTNIVMPLIDKRMHDVYPKRIKARPVIYTKARVRAARENIRDFDWAGKVATTAISAADRIVKRPLSELAMEMPSPSMPRGWHNYCPHCDWWGHGPSNSLDVVGRPWEQTCPACKKSCPGFDALKFYMSGRDELGWFHFYEADQSLLPKDPRVKKLALDSMWSYCRGYWSDGFGPGLTALSDAYVYTGKKKYARHACGLLVHFAYFYPFFMKRDCINGDTHPGTLIMDCHEACLLNRVALAYDQLFDALTDKTLLKDMSKLMAPYGFRFRTGSELKAYLEGRIFGTITLDMRRLWHGDGGERRNRDHFAYETIGVVLDKTPLGKQFEKVSWELRSQGYAEDGSARVGGLEYDVGCYSNNLRQLLKVLKYCKKAPVDTFADPTVRAAAYLYFDLFCLSRYYPNYGDACYCGPPQAIFGNNWGPNNTTARLRQKATMTACEYAQAYDATGIERLARIAHAINGNKTKGLHLGILDQAPEGIQARIQKVVDAATTPVERSFLACDLGVGILKSGRGRHRRALWMRTSRDHQFAEGGWHGHEDALSIGLMGFGLDLMPDVGFMDQKRWAFGHNLVSTQDTPLPKIDPKTDPHAWDETVPRAILSELAFIDEFPGVQVMQGVGVEHPETTRTVFLVDTGKDSYYIVDHVHISPSIDDKFVCYSFHSGQGKVKTNLRFATHPTTLIGESRNSGKWLPPTRKVAARDAGKLLKADIAIEDTYGVLPGRCDVQMRFMSLRPAAHIFESAYMPSQMRQHPGIPKRLPYFFMSEPRPKGRDKTRRFSTLIEPYRKTPSVLSARVIESGQPETEIIEVEEASGRRLHFVISDGKRSVTLPDGTKAKKAKATVQVLDGLSVRNGSLEKSLFQA